MGVVTAGVIAAAGAVGAAALSANAAKKSAAAQTQALNAQADANSNLAVPKVAKPPTAEEILAAYRNDVLGNFDAYKHIADKATDSDSLNQRNVIAAQNPQYYALGDQLNTNAEALNRGVLPDDVVQQVNQRANENSYLNGFTTGTGRGGGSFAGSNSADANMLLRNLGLTSLDAMKLGSSLTGQIQQEARAAAAPITRVGSILPGFGVSQTSANDAASYNQALLNRDAAVNNQGVQGNYLGQLAGAQGNLGTASQYSALSSILGSVAGAGLNSALGSGYTAGQTLNTPKKTAVSTPKTTAVY